MTKQGTRKQSDRAAATKGQIIAASRIVFSRKGVLGATIKDIEIEAGVPRALIYYHFGSLENIVAAITRSNLGRVRQLVQNEIAAMINESGEGEQSVQDLTLRLLELVERVSFGPGRAVSVHVWSAALVKGEIRETVEDMFSDIQADIQDFIVTRASPSRSSTATTLHASAMVLFSIVIPGYIIQRLLGGKNSLTPDAYLEGLAGLSNYL